MGSWVGQTAVAIPMIMYQMLNIYLNANCHWRSFWELWKKKNILIVVDDKKNYKFLFDTVDMRIMITLISKLICCLFISVLIIEYKKLNDKNKFIEIKSEFYDFFFFFLFGILLNIIFTGYFFTMKSK